MSTYNPADAGIPRNQIPRATFPLDYYRKFTTNFGRLVPVLCEFVMPSDNYEMSAEFILRTSPFRGQVFQQYRVSLDYFFVPNYILWNHFNLFLSGGYDGQTDYVHPFFDLRKFLNPNGQGISGYSNFQYLNSLIDYFDISSYQRDYDQVTRASKRFRKSLFPLASYAKIVLDHYTNQHLDCADLIQQNIERGFLLTADGEMNDDFIILMNRLHLLSPDDENIRKVTNTTFSPVVRPYDYDYFTSSLPDQQHGPVMTIPLSLVNTDANGLSTFKLLSPSQGSGSAPLGMEYSVGTSEIRIGHYNGTAVSSSNSIVVNGQVFENEATLYDFREAARLLEYFESIGLVGWKPEDFHLSQFNMKSKDQSLRQSVRIHHEVFNVNIGEIFSNNVNVPSPEGTHDDVPGVATSTAKGYGVGQRVNFRVPDYGYIIALMSVYPDAAYSQGCPAHFDILDRFDYPNWRFANLGLKPVYNGELYMTGKEGDDNVFGYTDPYACHKTRVNRVNSEFRNSYKYMCSSRLFNQSQYPAGRPKLNENFNKVQVNYNDLDRVFNVEFPLLENGPIILDVHHANSANRPLPYYGDPRL